MADAALMVGVMQMLSALLVFIYTKPFIWVPLNAGLTLTALLLWM